MNKSNLIKTPKDQKRGQKGRDGKEYSQII